MVAGPRYGYAIREAVEAASNGALSPPAGTLHRVISRMIDWGWITEAEPEEAERHPGRARRY